MKKGLPHAPHCVWSRGLFILGRPGDEKGPRPRPPKWTAPLALFCRKAVCLGVIACSLLFLLEWQLHQAQILAGLDQNQRAFIQHDRRGALAGDVHRLGLGSNRCLHSGNLVCVGVDPLQTRGSSQLMQLRQRQLIGLGLDWGCRRSFYRCCNRLLWLSHGGCCNGRRGFHRCACSHGHGFCNHRCCLHFCSSR